MLKRVAYPQSGQLLREALQGCKSQGAEVDDVLIHHSKNTDQMPTRCQALCWICENG